MRVHACTHTCTSTQVAKIQHFQVSPPGVVTCSLFFTVAQKSCYDIHMKSCKYVVFAVVKMH